MNAQAAQTVFVQSLIFIYFIGNFSSSVCTLFNIKYKNVNILKYKKSFLVIRPFNWKFATVLRHAAPTTWTLTSLNKTWPKFQNPAVCLFNSVFTVTNWITNHVSGQLFSLIPVLNELPWPEGFTGSDVFVKLLMLQCRRLDSVLFVLRSSLPPPVSESQHTSSFHGRLTTPAWRETPSRSSKHHTPTDREANRSP